MGYVWFSRKKIMESHYVGADRNNNTRNDKANKQNNNI